jgi:hypothetical protein
MSGTKIVAVRKALVAGLDALVAFDNVLVTYAWKVGAKEREKCFTTRASFTHQPASLRSGRTFRDEEGTFQVVIVVEGVGDSPDTVADRIAALGLAFEEYVADNRTLAGTNSLTVQGAGELTEMFNDRGSLAELTYTVRYMARLT